MDDDLYSVFDQEFGGGGDEAAPLAVVPPDVQSQVLGLYNQIGENRKRGDALRQQQLERATQMLEQRKFGPSMAERLFQLSAAFATPTRTRGLAGALGNIAPVLAQQAGASRQGSEQKEDLLRQLRDRYALSSIESEGAGYKDQLQALKLQAQLGKQPKPRLGLDPLGRGVVNLDDASIMPFGEGGGSAAVQPRSKAEYDALPPGAKYLAPDGTQRTKGGQTGSAPSGSFRP